MDYHRPPFITELGLKIGLASPRPASSVDDGLERVARLTSDAANAGAEIVCFPEAYIPGLRGQDFGIPPFEKSDEDRVLRTTADIARTNRIAIILGIEHITDGGRQVAMAVFAPDGTSLGMQTKNQLDPTEDRFYVPGTTRRVFEVNGTKFGIAICHEGWRYPETVRWAAARGAQIVFHPQLTGPEQSGSRLTQWMSPSAPYYEKAMMCRALENTIYFASVNYAVRFQESATAVIGPTGECEAFLPYGQEGVLVHDIDLEKATRLLAKRFSPEKYGEL